VINELQKMWKEWLWPNLVYCPGNLSGGTKGTYEQFQESEPSFEPGTTRKRNRLLITSLLMSVPKCQISSIK